MSMARGFAFLVLSALSAVWAVGSLFAASTRLEHRALIASIRSGTTNPDPDTIIAAIEDYEAALHVLPCQVPLLEDYAYLVSWDADQRLASEDMDASDIGLDAMQKAIAMRLSCTPTSGKAWMDYAMVTSVREGFSLGVLTAYKMSAWVSSGESWLAVKRLLFALKFLPFLDQEGRTIALSDMNVLSHAHPNRVNAVMKVAQVKTLEELRMRFTNEPAKIPVSIPVNGEESIAAEEP